MLRRPFLHIFLTFALSLTLLLTSVGLWTPASASLAPPLRGAPPQAQEAKAATRSEGSDLQARLAAIEKTVEAERIAKGIPGLALVIVRDDHVIYARGFGMRDVERKLPVTPDTLFAIGSCTKAFTAMAAVISQDEGKLSLDDSPKKYLPYFKINDPAIDEKITVRDLLSHRSGLAGTDIAWITGALNREEVIRVAGMAKPTARLGEKFQYQNVMYSAAGEVIARAQGSTWERVISERFLKPLGMQATRLTVGEMQRAPDYSLGYEYNEETKQTRRLPTRDLTNIAPAGAINSNVRDMAQWLRLLLGGGAFEGKRLVSEKGFAQLFSKVTSIQPKTDYGLGWIVTEWNNRRMVLHDGGIDGFNSEVALLPEEKLGFVLLTNVSVARLQGKVRNAIWDNLIGKPQAESNGATASAPQTASASDIEREVGTYNLAEANIDMKVTLKDGHLVLSVPGQPAYPLENIGGRRYKLADPAPDGFFITFRPVKENAAETEAYLEQPQGNYVLHRLKTETSDATAPNAATADYNGPLKDALGDYELNSTAIHVALKDGQVVLVVPGQPAYPLVEKERDQLSSPALPPTYSATIKRDASGRVAALVIKQPEGEFEFKRVGEFAAPITVDELITKVIEASGGAANLRKHKSMRATYALEFLNQGLGGEGETDTRAPNQMMQSLTFIALGKKIGWLRETFDGASGATETSFSLPEVKTPEQLDNARAQYDFYGPLNWKTLFKSIVIRKLEKVGDEDAYTVVMTPARGTPVTAYVSTKSFLILKRQTVMPGDDADDGATTETYSDYRAVDGVMIPFQTLQQSAGLGEVRMQLKEVKFDVALPDAMFRAQEKR